jgi:hypothetical protein
LDLEKNVARFSPATEITNIPMERIQFKKLLAQNPNYFGSIAKSELKPVKKIAVNTEYEELITMFNVTYGGELVAFQSVHYG